MDSLSSVRHPVGAVRRALAAAYSPDELRTTALSAGTSAITVVVCCIAFGPQLGVIAMLGAFMPYWETGRPFWARLRSSVFLTLALTACMAAGVVVAPLSWAIVPASVIVIVAVSVLYYAFMLTSGPSPVMMFYAAVLGTFFGADQQMGWQMVGVTACAGALASVLLLVPLAVDPLGPERTAVEEARGAVGRYRQCAEAGDPDVRLARNAAFGAVNTAWLTLQSAWPATRPRPHQLLTAQLGQITRDLAHTGRPEGGRGSAEFAPTTAVPPLPGRPSWRFLLSHALHANSIEWFTAWRMGLAAGIAGYISAIAGVGHPYWAILTATVVINQWRDRVATTRRAVHRAGGTVVGVLVVWALSGLHLSTWWTVAIVVLCMVGQYLTFRIHYALSLIFITPMALLAIEASGTGGTVTSLTFDRIVDTLIGAGTAVVVTWCTSIYFPQRLVRAQSARSATAIDALDDAVASGSHFTSSQLTCHAELQYELTHHQNILDRAVVDDPHLAGLIEEEQRVTDRGYTALAGAWAAPVHTADHARAEPQPTQTGRSG